MVWITLPHDYDEDKRDWFRFNDLPRMQNIAYNKNNILDHDCSLNVESLPHKTIRATAITCNVGNIINRDVESLLKMMQAGMNIAYIDLSLHHGDLEYHTQTIKNIRQAAETYSNILGVPYPVAISIDTVGPEIQTGYLEGDEHTEVEIVTGSIVKITSDPAYLNKGNNQVIYIDSESIFSTITPGRIIDIDDGGIHLVVQSISGFFMTCKVVIGGMLGNKKGIIFPGTKIDLPALTEVDEIRIKYAAENDLDILFCSLIRDPSAILEIRQLLGKKGKHIKLISNIANLQGIEKLDEIIEVSDGIVISRGDLFLEVTIPKLFLAQKYIAAKCNIVGCPVFACRELFESMLERRQPTRAEISDVANTVLDGCDVLFLAKETTRGEYCEDIIKFVSQICKEAEAAAWQTTLSNYFNRDNKLFDTLSLTAVESSVKCRAAAIFVITDTGNIAKIISKYRPRCPIVSITRDARIARQLHLYRSVIPLQYVGTRKRKMQNEIDAQVAAGITFGRERLFIQSKDPLIIVIDNIKNGKHFTNSMHVQYVPETQEIVDDVLYVT